MVDHLLRLLLANLDRSVSSPVIVAGGVGAGKTESCGSLVDELSRSGLQPGGILSPRVIRDGETVGYRVRDLRSGEERRFIRLSPPGISVGRYYVVPEALDWSKGVIADSLDGSDVVFIDEVGRLELEGKGLDSAVKSALGSGTQTVLLVRSEFLSTVRIRYDIEEFHLWRVEGAE